MTIVVEVVGGPDDGVRIELENTVDLNVAEHVADGTVWEMYVPVRHTEKGYRAYWYERRPR